MPAKRIKVFINGKRFILCPQYWNYYSVLDYVRITGPEVNQQNKIEGKPMAWTLLMEIISGCN
jgi:hypothetical protein